MILKTIALFVPLLLVSNSMLNAAVLSFKGNAVQTLLAGVPVLPTPVDFTLNVTTNGSWAGDVTNVTAAAFTFSNGAVRSVNVGTVVRSGNNLTFSLNNSPTNTTIASFTLTGSGMTPDTDANFGKVPMFTPFGTFSLLLPNSTGIQQFSGSIQSVPEPGSMAALAGLVMGTGLFRWKRRRAAQKS